MMMTSWPTMNHAQGRALAAFINTLRPDWDTAGVERFLYEARGIAAAPELAIAAVRAATSAHNRTPAVIPLRGPHWEPAAAAPVLGRSTRLAPTERCAICNQPEERCRQLAALPDDGHTFTRWQPRNAAAVDESTGEVAEIDPVAQVDRLRRAAGQ